METAEEDLVARSREWMNRPDREEWRKRVDDFLDDNDYYYKRASRSPRDRDRSPRERDRSPRERDRSPRSRSHERKRRGSSRDRRSDSPRRRSVDEDSFREGEAREYRREKPNWGGEYDKGGRARGKDKSGWSGQRWNSDSRKSFKETDSMDASTESIDGTWTCVDAWSLEEDNGSCGDKSEDREFDLSKFYGNEIKGSEDRYAYKKQSPQQTVIIRGLAQHITESDIRSDILSSGIDFKDIRLVRKRDTGVSRGFAFVEFYDVSDATKWIELKQGELMIGHFRALLQYSLPKNSYFNRDRWMTDWVCKCRSHNFRRRETCYRCHLSRRDGEVMVFESYSEMCTYPTTTIMLRKLDALTTEEKVLQSIMSLSTLPIRSVRIGRDPVTNVSRRCCYIEMNSVVDAMYLHNYLQSSTPVIDGHPVQVSYAKLDTLALQNSAAVNMNIANTAVAAAQWSHQSNDSNQSTSGNGAAHYTLADVPRLAEYSASMYARTPEEKSTYLKYYEDYYRKEINEGRSISLPTNSSDSSAAWASALAAKSKNSTGSEAPDGSGTKKYPVPEVSSYQYDKTSGYYYDPFTTLYYDANSQYYYNSKLAKFLYWDASKSTYLPAPTQDSHSQQTGSDNNKKTETKEEDKKVDKESEKDKVKVAKRIAKDMEKWAKTLNHKKEIAKQNLVAAQQAAVAQMKAVGSADIGYAVLERKELSVSALLNGIDSNKNESLVAAYGQGSDSEDESGPAGSGDPDQGGLLDERQHVDLVKLACLLCKRQFPSKDVLMKHTQMSDLHKQNLSAWYKSKGIDMEAEAASNKKLQYRDRAKERRTKYGLPDEPQPNRLKESYMKAREAAISYEEPNKDGIRSDNLGSKLLQKMGWQEGMGLGKTNQGRTNIIQAERRSATAGLGTKSVGVTPGPGETYKDCVKKMMQIRYNEIDQ